MLIMDGSDSESLIVYEIGHIWFYGVLGNNELDEAWIDEGFTSSQTRDYMIHHYGPKGFDERSDDWAEPYQMRYWSYTDRLHSDQWYSIRYITSGYDEPISRKSYQFKNGSSYRQNAYTKPSLMLNELKYILGTLSTYRSKIYMISGSLNMLMKIELSVRLSRQLRRNSIGSLMLGFTTLGLWTTK